ncbi:M23 family metallopeptidase [Pseudarthrobacter sp. ATCC 49987]|uniref:M23 family metallopeptidase n=1 Tax=Pseudarthrobacter sp. ATCC 49987 TaxID=2698204 RepID=UPI00136E90EA|nr:M23 family metallopeptidase [Pseudarthrobacter sp. ATCC 49987]
MRWPLKDFWISQGYSAGHQANDLAANQGVPIYAPESGVVTAVNNNPASYFGGNYVKMRGDSGNVYYMGHNSKNHVGKDARVAEGQHIADVGMTGTATGPHIHFQIEKGGKLLDPSVVMKNKVTSQGGEAMIQDTDNEYGRWHKLGYQIRGRNLTREEFRKSAVGRTWLTALEILSDNTESDTATHAQEIGQVAIRDDWAGQIYGLIDQLKAMPQNTSESEKKLQTIKDALGIK